MLIFRPLFFTSNCFFLWWSSDLTSVCSFSVWHNYPLLLGITLARLRLRGPVGFFVTATFCGGLPLNFPPLGDGAGLGAGRPRPLNFPPLGPEGPFGGVGLGPLPPNLGFVGLVGREGPLPLGPFLNLGFVGLGVGVGRPLNFPPLGEVDVGLPRPLNLPPRNELPFDRALASAALRAAM
jgi:hypothetical protein